jgi:DNA-binding transcriptional ArsR family regulator
MLDQLRHEIQTRLDELIDEIDRLRRALHALEAGRPDGTPKTAEKPVLTAAASGRASARPATSASRSSRATSPRRSGRRTAPGATKARILETLAGGEAMTASQVAAKAGLDRATVSTTLSKLAGNGEIEKAARGYRAAPAAKIAA